MTLAQFLATLPPADAAHVQACLHQVQGLSAGWIRVHASLTVESRLSAAAWQAACQPFFDPAWTPAGAESALVLQLRGLVGAGPVGPTAQVVGAPLGRAMLLDRFLDQMVLQRGYPSRQAARRALGQFQNLPVRYFHRAFRGMRLAAYNVMWSTFAPTGGDPFDALRHPAGSPLLAARVECGLGLPDTNPTAEYVLLRYAHPTGATFHMPTAAEGYAGGFQYYFNPRAAGAADHGMTLPCPGLAPTPAPVPEVVHRPGDAGDLTDPPEIVT